MKNTNRTEDFGNGITLNWIIPAQPVAPSMASAALAVERAIAAADDAPFEMDFPTVIESCPYVTP